MITVIQPERMLSLPGELAAIDRLVELVPGQVARGIRNVGGTHDIYDSHFPRKPVLPGVLMLGSVARLAGLLMTETAGGAWMLESAERVRFRSFVQPGDSVLIRVDLLQYNENSATLKAVAEVDGKKVFTAQSVTLSSQSGTQ
jgi:3-hydroxyacyl-[acyl-carrier-protein] dehydratase